MYTYIFKCFKNVGSNASQDIALESFFHESFIEATVRVRFDFISSGSLTLVKRTWAMGAHPMGAPGCPDIAFCTMSAARIRTVLIACVHQMNQSNVPW